MILFIALDRPTRRIKLTIEYDGRPFTGWQRQSHAPSVQGVIEKALKKVLQHAVLLQGAGRTDSGVHALAQVAHFDTTSPIPVNKIPRALPGYLPPEVSILKAEEVSLEFDARRDAQLRWYRYQIEVGSIRHPLGPRAWKIFRPPDQKKMERALEKLKGRHDFSGFRAAACTAERTVLTMKQASLVRSGDVIAIDFKCQSFLQRMVRLMVGAVVSVGEDKLTPKDISSILTTCERPSDVRAAPPQGLCLMRIAYSPEEAEEILNLNPPPPSF